MAGQSGGGGGFGGGSGPKGKEPDPDSGKPISEEVVWRARAIRAEAQLEQMQARISEIESQLSRAQTSAAQAEQKRQLELELAMANALDIEITSLAAQGILDQMDDPDVPGAVAKLRASKPFLFHAGGGASAMSQAVIGQGSSAVLGDLADEARETGDRAALLRYLRARRSN